MSGPGRYAALSAAVRSFKAELIKHTQVERLVEAGSLSEIASMLSNGQLTSVDVDDLSGIESFLLQRIITLSERLASYAPSDSRALIQLFALRHEYNCLKEILRSISEQVDPEEAVSHIVPAGRFTVERCKELIESRNPNRVVDAIQDEALSRFVSAKITGERGSLAAVSAVDQYFYARLWSTANLPDPLDMQSARGLLGESIDHLNILLALRARLIGLDARSTSDLFIPVNYALGHTLSELAESTNILNLMRAVEKTPYAKAVQNAATLEDAPALTERFLNRMHAESCTNAFAGSPFNVGLAIAFLFLKSYELRDLYAIINGKANNVPVERVRESLILT